MAFYKITIIVVGPVLFLLGPPGNLCSEMKDALTLSSESRLPPRAECRIGASSFVSGAEYPAFGVSSDGTLLAVACVKPTGVAIWDVRTRHLLSFLATDARVSSNRILFSLDGKRLFTYTREVNLQYTSAGKVQVWDIASKSLAFERLIYPGPSDWWKEFAVAPDGQVLAVSVGRNAVRLFDQNGNPLREVSLPMGYNVGGLSISRQGNLIVACEEIPAGWILLTYSMESGERISLSKLEGWPLNDQSVVISQLGRWAAVVRHTEDNKKSRLVILDTATGLARLEMLMEDSVLASLAFSPDESTIAIQQRPTDTIRVFSLDARREARELMAIDGSRCRLESLTFSHNAAMLAAATSSRVRLWKVPSATEIGTGFDAIRWLELSNDGSRLLVEDASGIRMCDARRGRELWVRPSARVPKFSPNTGFVSALLQCDVIGKLDSRTGETVEAISLRTWDGTSRFTYRSKLGSEYEVDRCVRDYVWSVDEVSIAYQIGRVRLALFDRNAETTQFSPVQPGHLVWPHSNSRSPWGLMGFHGSRVLWLSDEERMEDWDVFSNESHELGSFRGTVAGVTRDGKTCVVLSYWLDGMLRDSIRVWDIGSDEPRVIIECDNWQFPHSAMGAPLDGNYRAERISPVTISRDGQLLAVGGADGTVRIYSLRTGAAIDKLENGHVGPVTALSISGDGRWLASASVEGTIVVWCLPE